ncbi:MAG TPA: GtrA family protein [Solirubrobacteraceae bacterium]
MSATAIPRPRLPTLVAQLVRFGLVGATNTGLTLAAYSALVALVEAPVALAAALAWGVGAVNGFVLNRAWTFRGSPRGALPAARYAVVALAGSALNAALVSVAVSVDHLPHFAGELAVLPPVTVLSFLLCRGWVFAPGAPA